MLEPIIFFAKSELGPSGAEKYVRYHKRNDTLGQRELRLVGVFVSIVVALLVVLEDSFVDTMVLCAKRVSEVSLSGSGCWSSFAYSVTHEPNVDEVGDDQHDGSGAGDL